MDYKLKIYIRKKMIKDKFIAGIDVGSEVSKLVVNVFRIENGEIKDQIKMSGAILIPTTAEEVDNLIIFLKQKRIELSEDTEDGKIKKIKLLIFDIIVNHQKYQYNNFSYHIQKAVKTNFNSISQKFKKAEGINIERYIIRERINIVKEYIINNELSLTEIADELGYAHVAHLSSQFKKEVGLSPTEWKRTQ